MSPIKQRDLVIDGELVYVVALPALKALGSEVDSLKEVASDDLQNLANASNHPEESFATSDQDASTATEFSKAQLELAKYVQLVWQALPEFYRELEQELPVEKIRLKQWAPPGKEIRAFKDSIETAMERYDQKKKAEKAAAAAESPNDTSSEKNQLDQERTDEFQINFGERSAITENQKFLLDELISRESELAALLQDAFVEDYQIVSSDVAHDYGIEIGKRPWLPELSDHETIKKLYQIRNIFMAPESICIGFEIGTPWTTTEDGPYGLLLENFDQTTFGLQQDAWCQEE